MMASRAGVPGPVDISATANQRIWDFVHQPANLPLRPGTGHYSTPFRGGLFDEVRAEAIAKRLPGHGVDVLWLGANPCMPESLDHILSPPPNSGHFPSFVRQMASGFFGSSRWGPDGEPQPDFNPIQKPTGSWGVYRDLFERIGRLSCVAMANFIPWGSQNMGALITKLGGANRGLLHRVLEFADDLNAEIAAALRPRWMVVPFSLAREPALAAAGIGLSLKRAPDAMRHKVPLPEGVFNLYTATCRRGNLVMHTAFVRHPSALRMSVDSKKRLVDEVAAILGAVQG